MCEKVTVLTSSTLGDVQGVSRKEFARAMAIHCILKEDETTRAMSIIEFLVFTGEQYGLLMAESNFMRVARASKIDSWRFDSVPDMVIRGISPICDLARAAMEDAVENPGKFDDPSMLSIWHGIEENGSETYHLWAREGIVASGHRA